MREKTSLSSYTITTEHGRYFATIQGSHVTNIGRVIKTVQLTLLEWFEDGYGDITDRLYNTHVYTAPYDYSGNVDFCYKFVNHLESSILEKR